MPAAFPAALQCEKLGQTIIFVRTRETARALHAAVSAGRCLPPELLLPLKAAVVSCRYVPPPTTACIHAFTRLPRCLDPAPPCACAAPADGEGWAQVHLH